MHLNINTPKNNINFQAKNKYTLPTRIALECATDTISKKTKEAPMELFSTYKKLFHLDDRDIVSICTTPMAELLYELSTGRILRKNNPKIQQFCERVNTMPEGQRLIEIDKMVNKIGEKINVVVDDSINTY